VELGPEPGRWFGVFKREGLPMRTQISTAVAIVLATVVVCGAAPLQIVPGHTPSRAATPGYQVAANESVRQAAGHRKMAARKRALRAEMRVALPEGRARPRVYLLRGLMNVFSLGMDDLAAELRRSGIEATVTNHAESERLVNAITANYAAGDRRPIVLIGHSLGADAVMLMAASLDRNGVPVDLVIPFDATAAHEASANIARVVNMTKHFMVTPGPGFHGALANIDLSQDPGIDHLNIDKSPRLHAQVINDVRQLAATPRALSRPPAPATTFVSGG
jgi:hypothetical protein